MTGEVSEVISDTDVVEEEVAGVAVEEVAVVAEAEADTSRDPTERQWETADFRVIYRNCKENERK